MPVFTLKTLGLTHKEAAEVCDLLRHDRDIEDVQMRFSNRDAAWTGVPQASITAITLLISLVGPSVALMAKGALEQMGKQLYDKTAAPFVNQLGDWLNSKMTGTSSVQVVVKLYGPDGELLKEIQRTR